MSIAAVVLYSVLAVILNVIQPSLLAFAISILQQSVYTIAAILFQLMAKCQVIMHLEQQVDSQVMSQDCSSKDEVRWKKEHKTGKEKRKRIDNSQSTCMVRMTNWTFFKT